MSLVEDYINQKCRYCKRAGIQKTYNHGSNITKEVLLASRTFDNSGIEFCFALGTSTPSFDRYGYFLKITNGHIYHCKTTNMFTKLAVQHDYTG